MELTCQVPHEYLLGLTAFAILEWWLGRTGRVRPASTIEIILSIITLIITYFLKGRKKDG